MWAKIERFGETWWGMMIVISIPLLFVLSFQLSGNTEILPQMYQPFQFSVSQFYQNAIRSGQSIFWNPYVLSGGFPMFVSITGGFFFPLFYLLLKFLSVPSAWHGLTFVDLLLMGGFTALIAKKMNISTAGQYLAGTIYIFSAWQYIFSFIATNALLILPFLVWILLELEDKFRWWLTIAGIMVVAFGWFSTYWQFFLFILPTVSLFALFLAWQRFQRDIKNPLRPLWHYLGMCAGGTLIGFLQIIPTLTFIPLSVQLSGGGYSYAQDIWAGINFSNIITLFFPFFDHPFITVAPFYVGILPLFLFLVGLKFSLRNFQGFLSWLFVVMVLLAVAYSPLFLLLQNIPPFNFTHGPFRWIYMGGFALALLAGFGLDQFKEKMHLLRIGFLLQVTKWFLLATGFVAMIDAFFLYIVKDRLLFLLNTYFDEFVYKSSMLYSIDYYHVYLERLAEKTLHLFDPLNPQFALPFLFIGISYIFIRFYRARDFNFNKSSCFVIVITTLNFILVFLTFDGITSGQQYLDSMPQTVRFLISKPKGSIIAFLGTQSLFEKLTVPHSGDKNFQKELYNFNSELMLFGTNIKYNLEYADLLDPLASGAIARLVSYVGSPLGDKTPNDDPTTLLLTANLSLKEKTNLFYERRSILSLLGIRYITSAYALDEKVLPKVFEITATSYNIPIYIYENKQARPLYYFTKETELLDLPATTTPQYLHNAIEASDKSKFITQEGTNIIGRGNAFLRLITDTKTNQLLVFSQNNLPGWRVFIDNQRVPLHTFATVYQAIEVPQGHHEIRFEYKYWEIWREFFGLQF